MHFTTSVFFTICTVTTFFKDASAVPVQTSHLRTRDVFDPPITFPNQNSVFQAGETITVTWDTSSIPAGTTDLGEIALAQPTFEDENLDFDHPLATGFLLTAGQQDITFPSNLTTASNYALVLFGDSGNISPNFTILGSLGVDLR